MKTSGDYPKDGDITDEGFGMDGFDGFIDPTDV